MQVGWTKDDNIAHTQHRWYSGSFPVPYSIFNSQAERYGVTRVTQRYMRVAQTARQIS
jgi:hypothetical protein